MFRKNITLAFRVLLKHKSISLINIIGFSISLACAFFILLWVEDELSYDRFHPDYKQLYRVEEDQYYSNSEPYHVTVTPNPSGPVWRDEIPEIIEQCRLSRVYGILFNFGDIKYIENSVCSVDSSFFRLFGYRLISGSPETVLNEPNTMAVSESTAKKYFGDEHAIGKSIKLNNDALYTVTGVYKDPPANSIFVYDVLLPWSYMESQPYYSENWGSNSIYTIVKTHPDIIDTVINRKITEVTNLHKEGNTIDFMIAPLHKVHLHAYFGYGKNPGAIIYVYIFSAIAIFVLIIACINFMNLATSKASLRAREIGMRKVNGASRKQLIIQHLTESFIQTILSVLLAFLLVAALLFKFNDISGKELEIIDIFNGKYLLGLLVIILFTGFLSGSYPAFYLSSFNPIKSIKDSADSKSGSGLLRKVLVVFQFTIALLLIAGSLIIGRQLDYMRNADLGFNEEHLLRIPLAAGVNEKYETLKNEFSQFSFVKNISATRDQPHYIGNNSGNIEWPGKDPEKDMLVSFTAVDFGYTETMDITIVNGRRFSEDFQGDLYRDTTANFLINQTLARIIGEEDPVGMDLTFMGVSGKIVGVMEDFHFSPLREKIEPLAIIPVPGNFLGNLVLRIQADDIDQAIADMEETWNNLLPEYPFRYNFVDEEIDRMYRSEKRMSTLIRLFTIVAIVISCLGLFALAAFSSERRIREIGIRKTFGAMDAQILVLMLRDFSWFILISILIGVPATWLLAHSWLQGFAFRIHLSPGVFILSSAIVLVVAILTVSYQAVRASRMDPADTLHYE
jgi:predicted permease